VDAPFLYAGVGSRPLVRTLDLVELTARVTDGGMVAGLRALQSEVNRGCTTGFTTSELEREKRALLRWYDRVDAERDHRPSGAIAEQLVAEYVTHDPTLHPDDDVALGRALIPTLTLDEVRRTMTDMFSTSGRVALVSGPAEGLTTMPTAAALLAALENPSALPAYVDSAPDVPLLAEEPLAGRVVAVANLEAVGAQLWTLSNGVRVILKPTALDPDEVLLTSYRDGGTSVAADSDLVPAASAIPMVAASGLGPYDASALHRRLRGTLVSVGSTIGAYGEGVWGNASRNDALTLFQLVYLAFTAPRIDSSAVRQFEASLRDALMHRGASPEAAYDDTLAQVLSGHSPRVPLLNDRYLAQLDPAKSLAFVRRRFADATDFTFVVVGAFDVDSVKPLVERYLGGLPASGAPSRWRDTGVRPPSGTVNRVIRKGREPRGATTLVFLGTADSTHQERRILLALTNVLQQRLWERLREELGSIYGVSVSWDQETVPCPSYRIDVSFGADPRRLNELTEAVFAVIAELATNGPTPVELEKFKEGQRRGREIAMTTNGFWLQSLALYDQRGWPLQEIPGADTLVDAMSAADVQAASGRYLDTSHYVQVSLIPEDLQP
jgi:zinc protease